MTPNDLKKKIGTRFQAVLNDLKKIREPHVHEVTRRELDRDGFGKSLRVLREDADMSLRTMAKKLGCSAAFLSDCELGQRNMPLSTSLLFVHYATLERPKAKPMNGIQPCAKCWGIGYTHAGFCSVCRGNGLAR